MKIKFYSFLLFLALTFNYHKVNAQADAAEFLKAGKEDGNKLINAYMGPLLDGFAATLNNGWYNTARHHGLMGFDLTLTLSVTTINANQKTFDGSGLNLNNDPNKTRIVLVDSNGSTQAQTIYGSNISTTRVNVHESFGGKDTIIASFLMPPGLAIPVGLGLPNLQAAVGVGLGTEVMIRITPGIKSGGFRATMFGLGVKHNISYWIWEREKKPIDISGVFGFSSLKSTYDLGDDYLKPQDGVPGASAAAAYQNSQKFVFEGSGYMIGAVISKKLSILTLYLGANYNHAKVKMSMEGIYPVTFMETRLDDPKVGKPVIVNFQDPIVIESNLSYLRATGGLRLKLGPITLSAEYNLGRVNTIGGGIGINVQSIRPFSL
ncbi:MAG: hypothetical protein H7296_00935 [Bacteroidia bacterium]|nr:hypothetical protein [Bacteroidia bacterium]